MFTTQTRVSDIVRNHYQTAQVFEKYGVDFCCKGKRPLAEACEEKGLETNEVFSELQNSLKNNSGADNHYESWSPAFLADYIIEQHHNFVRQNAPTMLHHARKVSMRHGNIHPENIEIEHHVTQLIAELLDHMEKEETTVFPLIKRIAAGENTGENNGENLEQLIAELEGEHTGAGDLLEKVRELSNNFTPPANACTTYKLLYAELDAFEKDLHKHVHLENNILFPKVIAMSSKKLVNA